MNSSSWWRIVYSDIIYMVSLADARWARAWPWLIYEKRRVHQGVWCVYLFLFLYWSQCSQVCIKCIWQARILRHTLGPRFAHCLPRKYIASSWRYKWCAIPQSGGSQRKTFFFLQWTSPSWGPPNEIEQQIGRGDSTIWVCVCLSDTHLIRIVFHAAKRCVHIYTMSILAIRYAHRTYSRDAYLYPFL